MESISYWPVGRGRHKDLPVKHLARFSQVKFTISQKSQIQLIFLIKERGKRYI